MSGELKNYAATVNGVETTLRLTEADAKARGLIADNSGDAEPAKKVAKASANKARTAPSK